MQAWQEEVERSRQGQRDAESKLSSMEASHFTFGNLFISTSQLNAVEDCFLHESKKILLD